MHRESVGYKETISLIEDGKNNVEIAEALGIPVGTVRSRRSRYKASLKNSSKESPTHPNLQSEITPGTTATTNTPGGKRGVTDELTAKRQQFKAIDGGQPDHPLVELPTLKELKQSIWADVSRLDDQPALKLQAYNAYMRCLTVEKGLPSSEINEEEEYVMTDEERDERIAEIIRMGMSRLKSV